MSSKNELQNILKNDYGINKNITQSLTPEDCKELEELLEQRTSLQNLIHSFIDKNKELSQNNRFYGQRRAAAEQKFVKLEKEYVELEHSIANIEADNRSMEQQRQKLLAKQQSLKKEFEKLEQGNKVLLSKVKDITSENEELTKANEDLQRDNKELKNVVDQIRLRLAKDVDSLLKYEDSEIRKSLIRLFRWTLG